MLKFVYAAAAVAFAVSASGSFAQQSATQAPAVATSQAASRANEVICRKEEVTGSRLGAKKVCRTRAEWADAQLQDRRALERAQTDRPMKGN